MGSGGGIGLKIEEVTQEFEGPNGTLLALDNISLDIAPGEFVSLLGPSGCGKSTLLLAFAGLQQHTSGRISIGDQLIERPYTDLGIVFQEPFLLEWRTVIENVMLQAEMRDLDMNAFKSRAAALLDRVGLAQFTENLPYQLSGGMRQRTSICRALLHDPPLLLMDEPFGALDALTRDDLNLEIQEIWMRSPKTVVFVTHSISEAVFLSDRVIVMSPRPGRIAEIIKIELPRPRRFDMRESSDFGFYAKHIRQIFTAQGILRPDPVQ